MSSFLSLIIPPVPEDLPTPLDHPRICGVDLPGDVAEAIKKKGYFIFEGSLGSTIKLPNNKRGDGHYMLLDYRFPDNFHEYDISFVDLISAPNKAFRKEEHVLPTTSQPEVMQLFCGYPTTIFDPRPLVSSFIASDVNSIQGRVFLEVIFACKEYSIEYEPVLITGAYHKSQNTQTHSIYSFWQNIPLGPGRKGKDVTICKINPALGSLIDRFSKDFRYEQTFTHPKIWDGEFGNKNNPDFVPILRNINQEIVAFSWKQGSRLSFVFPDVHRKAEFLTEFLQEVAPAFIPEIFPHSTQFKWIEDPVYFLSGHQSLLEEKEKAQQVFDTTMTTIEKKISENKDKYGFLHRILTETGDALVQAAHDFLQWLGFSQVTIMDKVTAGVTEEDIQAELENGIIVIEVKGIGGTSSDSDCSQIAKIRTRRTKQRNAFDVTALYIVNHQRYLPPEKRKNPPFTEHQITDAKHDERGLLTTWQLFQLFKDIEDGILTKEDARNAFLETGLIIFKPKIKSSLGMPKELYKEGHVAILDIANTPLKIGQTLMAEKNGRYRPVTIQSIQVNSKPVNDAENGEVGVMLDSKVDLSTILWTL